MRTHEAVRLVHHLPPRPASSHPVDGRAPPIRAQRLPLANPDAHHDHTYADNAHDATHHSDDDPNDSFDHLDGAHVTIQAANAVVDGNDNTHDDPDGDHAVLHPGLFGDVAVGGTDRAP